MALVLEKLKLQHLDSFTVMIMYLVISLNSEIPKEPAYCQCCLKTWIKNTRLLSC